MTFRPPKKPALTLDASLVQVNDQRILYCLCFPVLCSDYIVLCCPADLQYVQDDLPLEVIPKVFIGSIHSAFNAVRQIFSMHSNSWTVHIFQADLSSSFFLYGFSRSPSTTIA